MTGYLYSVSPDDNILSYYADKYDSAYILLHPFLRLKTLLINDFKINVKKELACETLDELFDYIAINSPSPNDIVNGTSPVSWQVISEKTGLRLSEIDVGLRTLIGGLKQEFKNDLAAEKLHHLEKHNILCPTEGILSPHLENRLLRCLTAIGYQSVITTDEFQQEKQTYSTLVRNHNGIAQHAGGIFTPDDKILFTTHWDSHFSLIYSNRKLIEKILSIDNFEGFFCTDKTDVYWGLYPI